MSGTTRNTITRSEFERILAHGIEIQNEGEYQRMWIPDKYGMLMRYSPEAVKRNSDAIFGKQEPK